MQDQEYLSYTTLHRAYLKTTVAANHSFSQVPPKQSASCVTAIDHQ
jgi:hypothetical protein